MPPAVSDKRSRLIDAAVRLVHRQGFHRTTLADVAGESRVPLGNLYYYFRTKDALGEALIDRYIGRYEALRAQWDAMPDPKARLEAFTQMTADNRETLARSGCPIGTLSSELRKEVGDLATSATRLFDDLLRWLEAQFRLLGQSKHDAHGLAIHLLSALEGASLLAHNFGSAKYAAQEAALLRRWIREL
jgi:TetR/AcrR family transcriptional regulator, transcriptional repressor for nem operon